MLGSDYSIGSENGVLPPKPTLHYRLSTILAMASKARSWPECVRRSGHFRPSAVVHRIDFDTARRPFDEAPSERVVLPAHGFRSPAPRASRITSKLLSH